MGKVYLAESAFLTEYKQQVAIKMLSALGANERQSAIMRDLFLREANLQVQLKHPHIVSVIQFAAEDDEYYLILEYLPGYQFQGKRISNVADVLAYEQKAIKPTLAFKWFIQALDAMSYAHNFRYRWQGQEHVGIVHRDIKPANLLLADPQTIKVSDFGIVKVRQHGGTVTQNLNPGTSAYMSPEAILGPGRFNLSELDGRSDIYSLGVTLFEMVAGRPPFLPVPGQSRDGSLRKQQIEAPPPSPSSLNPELDAEIDALILRAIAKHPDQRYQTAEEFKRALVTWLRLHAPSSVTAAMAPASSARPAGAATEIIRKVTAATPAVATPPPGTGDPFLTRPVFAPEVTDGGKGTTPIVEEKKSLPWALIGAAIILVLAAVAGIIYALRPAEKVIVVAPPVTSPTAAPTLTIPDGLVAIAGGSFLMGRDLTEEEKNFKIGRDRIFSYDYPAHEVMVKDFYLDRREVSNREYAEFVRATGRRAPDSWGAKEPPPDTENLPVTFVDYQDATDFCAWRAKAQNDGFIYRLPTEEEWEYAARGKDAGKPGAAKNLYPWGEEWLPNRANTSEAKLNHTQLVTANPQGASPFGILNLSGNVYEWTATDFVHYPGSDQQTPREEGYQGVYQVVRGGSFDFPKERAMTTTRVWSRPTDKGPRLGFRCAADRKN
jgi:formylglycine-generating enzyme required for sulfatase activity